MNGFYNGYSNRVLWPLFHDIKFTATSRQQDQFWQVYKQVNLHFADVISKTCKHNNASIWIHDYQLLLLPNILRNLYPNRRIGFFLHIPFPSASKFTKLKNAKELISGIIGSEIIGFHIQGYIDNFLESYRQLKIGSLSRNKVKINSRIVQISNFPMGINYNKIMQISHSKQTKKRLSKLNAKYQGKKVLLTVDRLDPTKGLVQRVLAYRDLLFEKQHLQNRIVLVMLAVPSRIEIKEYQNEKEQLEALVNSVNNEFSTEHWQPIEYNYECLLLEDLIPLYQLADIAFIAPITDGMNLVAKEYIASKLDNNGVLVLSQTAGAAKELHDALLVNPNNRASLVQGLATAITMPESERKDRMRSMRKIVSSRTAQSWANDFTKLLFNV